VVVTLPTHREFKPTYFRRYYGYEEHDFVTGFQKNALRISDKITLLIGMNLAVAWARVVGGAHLSKHFKHAINKESIIEKH
jgi:hypothetical protein